MKSAVLSFLLFAILLSFSLAATHEEDSCKSKWSNNEPTHCGCDLKTKQLDDVYEELWVDNMDIAKKTLNVDFLIQMQSGSLDAYRFVKFMVQDIFYLQEVTNMLKEVSEKDGQPDDLKEFLKGRYDSYKDFLDFCESQYLIMDPTSITPTPATEKYLNTYRNVAETESDTIYFTVALLPCSRLWVWLANNLKMDETNAYIHWKKDNMDGHPQKFQDILNKYLNTEEKKQLANDIFRKQMQNEHDFFFTS